MVCVTSLSLAAEYFMNEKDVDPNTTFLLFVIAKPQYIFNNQPHQNLIKIYS
jgi:hypothetical protein